jgi:hypothetical protein
LQTQLATPVLSQDGVECALQQLLVPLPAVPPVPFVPAVPAVPLVPFVPAVPLVPPVPEVPPVPAQPAHDVRARLTHVLVQELLQQGE